MAPHDVARAVHRGGRIVLWIVVALLGLATLYSTAIVAMNWNAISV